MVALIVAVAVFLFGLLLMAVAFLSAHRTFMPVITRPGLLWWPGVALLLMAVLILNLPAHLAFKNCERACDIVGRPSAEATSEPSREVQKDFDSCVSNGIGEVNRRALEARQAGAEVDAEAEVKKAEPGIRELCEVTAVERCITTCYRIERTH